MTLSLSHRRAGLLCLLFASGAGLLSAGTPRPQDLSRTLSSRSVTGWVLADFSGNEDFGLATASSARHDARGYSQEVRVRFGSHRQSSFKFRSRSATVDLSTFDLDGDQDRDLVVREPLSMKPIGVWLNDGHGSFHEGNLADFPALGRSGPTSAWRVQRSRISLVAVCDERVPLLVPGESALSCFSNERVARESDSSRRDPHQSAFRNRGPPRNS